MQRAEFLRGHFPQALCEGCRYRRDCDWLLLGVQAEAHEGNFWLVRKQPPAEPGGREEWCCARKFSVTAPNDIVRLRMHESWVLARVQQAAGGR